MYLYGVLRGSGTGKLRCGRIYIAIIFSQKMIKKVKLYIVVELVPIVFFEEFKNLYRAHIWSENEKKAMYCMFYEVVGLTN